MPDVSRIVKPRDSRLNGFAIGAGLGVLIAASGPGEARYNPDYNHTRFSRRAILALGGIGAAIDALSGSSWTV